MIRVRLFTLSPSTTHWKVRKTSTLLHVLHHIYMDWYPRPIFNSNHSIYNLKNKPTSNHNSNFFPKLVHTYNLPYAPLDKCFMELLRTFNYTNNFSIVVYFVMRWPRLNKWKIKANYTSFSFLSISITPWIICYNIVSRPLAKYNFSLVTWMLFFQKK